MFCSACGSSRCAGPSCRARLDRGDTLVRDGFRSPGEAVLTPHAQRGFLLLGAAAVALLVLLVNELNEGAAPLTQMATAVLVLDGGLGAVLLARGLVRH